MDRNGPALGALSEPSARGLPLRGPGGERRRALERAGRPLLHHPPAYASAELEVVDLSPFEKVRLPMAWRQDLHLLFKEALHNALRHSGCRRAELSVTLRGRRLEVVLQDDGRGFDPEHGNGQGEGLGTMRRRAARLGGRLDLSSSPAGTTVRFTGPAP